MERREGKEREEAERVATGLIKRKKLNRRELAKGFKRKELNG